MTGSMKAALVLLLLISMLSSSEALPMDIIQKTFQLIQTLDTNPTDSVTLGNAQDVRLDSFGFRQKRANTRKPAQYCAGCFSVIGDPTKSQQ